MKKTVFSLLLGICVLLAGCNDNPDSDPTSDNQTGGAKQLQLK